MGFLQLAGRLFLVVTTLAVLVACGGGGGGGAGAASSQAQLTLQPASYSICMGSQGKHLNPMTFYTTATISPLPDVPASTIIYGNTLTSEPVFSPTPLFLGNARNSVLLWFPVLDTLPVGEHRGTATVKICSTPECTDSAPLAVGTFEYSVSVAPVTQLLVGGVHTDYSQPVLIHEGGTAVVTSNVPVRWDDTMIQYGQLVSSTPTRVEFIAHKPGNLMGDEFPVRGMPSTCDSHGDYAYFKFVP